MNLNPYLDMGNLLSHMPTTLSMLVSEATRGMPSTRETLFLNDTQLKT
jgi:hypothetical protein